MKVNFWLILLQSKPSVWHALKVANFDAECNTEAANAALAASTAVAAHAAVAASGLTAETLEERLERQFEDFKKTTGIPYDTWVS